jgi:uncharacterized protein YndB with AHSA1/START domain
MTEQIERDLRLPAPTSEVWDALTDPALLEQWLADEVELHLRPGGDARFRSGAVVREGWVEEVLPPRSHTGSGRLAFWWATSDEPASRVEITLTPLPEGGTRVRMVESRPLEMLDLVGTRLPGAGGVSYGPALVAA